MLFAFDNAETTIMDKMHTFWPCRVLMMDRNSLGQLILRVLSHFAFSVIVG